MPQEQEFKQLYNSVIDAFEHTAPSKWRRLIKQVLDRTRFEDLQEFYDNKLDLRVRKFFDEYLELKSLLGMLSLQNGSAFRRQFWENLANLSKHMPIEEMEGYSQECCAMFMRELLATFTREDLSKAEELNDAGYERHHPGSYEKAIPLHDQAIDLEPAFSLAWINKGIALKNLNRFDEAIACYDHVIKNIDSRFKKAWHNKGVALMMKGELKDAIASFDQAISIDPTYDIARRVREQCLTSQQLKKPQGQGLLETLIKKFDNNQQALGIFQMACRLQSYDNYLAAARLFDQLCSMMTDDDDLLVCAGNAWYEAAQKSEAFERFQKAIALNATNGEAWMNLTRCYIDQEKFMKALDAANKATQYVSDNSMAWANRACVLCALKRDREGVESAKQAVKLDDHNPYGLYYLGACLMRLRRKEKARIAFEGLIRVDPDCNLAQSAREILRNL